MHALPYCVSKNVKYGYWKGVFERAVKGYGLAITCVEMYCMMSLRHKS